MMSSRTVNSEPIPGYRLLEPLGKGGFGEVWKCEAPGGLLKAIKFVAGAGDSVLTEEGAAEQELRALQHIKTIRHPFLLSMDRVERVGGALVIVMELADRSLQDVFKENLLRGRLGIPRAELLRYLRETAEVLDLLNFEHGLQHLDIKPRNLLLVGKHIKVADFGLVNSLADRDAGDDRVCRAITPRYAAPETFDGRFTPFSDQYSLALTYHELLTGAVPWEGASFRELALLHSRSEPELTNFAPAERAVLAVALARDPDRRYPSCMALIEALEGVPCGPGEPPPVAVRPQPSSADIDLGRLSGTDRARGTGTLGDLGQPRSGGLAARVAPRVDPLADYQFQECLQRLPGGELWRAMRPDGQDALVRYLSTPEPADQPRGSAQRLAALSHPHLAPFEVLTLGPNRVALVSAPGDGHLGSELRSCQGQGLSGIPREDLLGYLNQVACALDDLAEAHHLAHLTLSPRVVTLRDEKAALLDFALAELFWMPAGIQPATLNARYAAPEVFEGRPCPASDQHSLALIFAEMVVGQHPYRNLNSRQMAAPRLRGQPDLALLSAADRAVVLKAIHPDPASRFGSCMELVEALAESVASADSTVVAWSQGPTRVARVPGPALGGPAVASGLEAEEDWRAPLHELVSVLARDLPVRSLGGLHYLLHPDQKIEHRCSARLVPGTVRLKLSGFREAFRAEKLSASDKCYVYTVRRRAGFWQRWFGQPPGVEVVVQVRPAREDNTTPLRISVRPIHCARGKAASLLDELGLHVLAGLQEFLQSQGELRDQERYPYQQTVQVLPAGVRGPAPRPVTAQARDLGRGGMTLSTTERLPERLEVQLPACGAIRSFRVPGRVAFTETVGDRHLEAEVTFEG